MREAVMKPANALFLSVLAGITTFSVEHYVFPAQLHAAAFIVPKSANWRQQMIDQDPGGAIVETLLDKLRNRLDLSEAQTTKARPLLEKQHQRILALLLTAPPSLTRDQFLAERQRIRMETHRQLEAVLTPEQRDIANQLARAH